MAEEKNDYKVDIEKILSEGNTVEIKPRGYSMYPLFVPERDIAVIKPVGEDVLKRGDVVLYRREESILVLHRIWKKKGDQFYMVGDNQKETEGPIYRFQIKGKLIGIKRKGRYLDVRNPIYRFLFAVWLFLRPLRPLIAKAVHGAKERVKKSGN